ncbi:MAG: hypothetical protein DRI90_03270 [Deltaproteobacteria bacterium]|nr:MAG: hypothetical protein DRI90_03270 [Deltaproteobacteria bacterium]
MLPPVPFAAPHCNELARWAQRVALVALWLGGWLLCCGCDERPRANSAPGLATAPVPTRASSPLQAEKRPRVLDGGTNDSSGRCKAPSLALRAPIDGRDDAAFERCAKLRTGPAKVPDECGMGEPAPALDLPRLDAAVLPLEPATVAHLQAIVERGKKLGRQPRAFGLVGDSMTVSSAFLRSFAADRPGRIELAPAVQAALGTQVDGQSATIIDFYRGVNAQRLSGQWRDSFAAIRAAKVGARAVYPVAGGTVSPLSTMSNTLSPAVAVVLYGGNDAAFRAAPVAELADRFERELGAVIDALEQAGIVPILNTVARHGHAPGIDDCGKPGEMTNWRIAVQTNALSARVVEIACQRRLPLIDLRHALDGADHHGLGHDGVHPSAHQHGSARLTARGLRCGYNVRNYVTLKMLQQVKEAVLD